MFQFRCSIKKSYNSNAFIAFHSILWFFFLFIIASPLHIFTMSLCIVHHVFASMNLCILLRMHLKSRGMLLNDGADVEPVTSIRWIEIQKNLAVARCFFSIKKTFSSRFRFASTRGGKLNCSETKRRLLIIKPIQLPRMFYYSTFFF